MSSVQDQLDAAQRGRSRLPKYFLCQQLHRHAVESSRVECEERHWATRAAESGVRFDQQLATLPAPALGTQLGLFGDEDEPLERGKRRRSRRRG